MSKKVCCRCKEEKEEEDFTFKNKSQNIRNKTCKKCFIEIRKNWYNKNKLKVIQKINSNKNKNKLWFEDYKKKLVCSNCGENHIACLDFHHLDPNKKELSITAIARNTYSIKRIMEEINKCIVLCSNCHRKLHYNENHAPIVQRIERKFPKL